MFTVAVKKENKTKNEVKYICSKCKCELGSHQIEKCPKCKRRIVIWD